MFFGLLWTSREPFPSFHQKNLICCVLFWQLLLPETEAVNVLGPLLHVALAAALMPWLWLQLCIRVLFGFFVWARVWSSCAEVISSARHTLRLQLCQSEARPAPAQSHRLSEGKDSLFSLFYVVCACFSSSGPCDCSAFYCNALVAVSEPEWFIWMCEKGPARSSLSHYSGRGSGQAESGQELHFHPVWRTGRFSTASSG